jgi:hypothetical protein
MTNINDIINDIKIISGSDIIFSDFIKDQSVDIYVKFDIFVPNYVFYYFFLEIVTYLHIKYTVKNISLASYNGIMVNQENNSDCNVYSIIVDNTKFNFSQMPKYNL